MAPQLGAPAALGQGSGWFSAPTQGSQTSELISMSSSEGTTHLSDAQAYRNAKHSYSQK